MPLPSNTTAYVFANGSPNDGFYTVSNFTDHFGWFDIEDHTPNNTNGRMLIINADFTPGEFYRTTINGLCENTSYEFSSWMVNLSPSFDCGGSPIPINVKFEIWDNINTNLMASGDTGTIAGTASPNWQQYALVFQTLPSQTSVILKMLNNGVGGCGNDLAIDDIVFKSCGDSIIVNDAQNNSNSFVCEGVTSFFTELTAIPDFSIFSTHFYQWQQSLDGINWMDISGETNQIYATPILTNTAFYRVKVAEDAINLSNDLCNTISDVFEIRFIPVPDPPISNGNLSICENDPSAISVSVPNDVIVNWYDAAVGGNLLLTNRTSFNPSVSGIYYAEAESISAGCISASRTPVEMEFLEMPQVMDEAFSFCENTSIRLHADVINASIVTSYLWNTGAITEYIDVITSGTYTVEVSNGNCKVVKTIILTQIDNPIINTIASERSNIIVTTSNTGDFLYSLDGVNYQSGNTFFNVEGGLYTFFVKELNCPESITAQYLHFYIPQYFTPNNDGVHDTFDLSGIEFYSSSEVSIFDRYGKLLKFSKNASFSWDGTFNSEKLQSDDYWYVIIIEGQKFTGHFTLKR